MDTVNVNHMKTTVDIPDALLRRAKLAAARRGSTLKTILAEALREALDAGGAERSPIEHRTPTFRGKGLQPGLAWGDWESLRSMAYLRVRNPLRS